MDIPWLYHGYTMGIPWHDSLLAKTPCPNPVVGGGGTIPGLETLATLLTLLTFPTRG